MSCCFNSLRQIRSIQRSVSRPVLLSLVTSLVLTRLDYGSATLVGVSGRLLDRLQSMLNAAARLVCNSRKYDHISPLLCDLHLRVSGQIKFRLTVLLYRCLSNTTRAYLSRSALGGRQRHLETTSFVIQQAGGASNKMIGDRAVSAAITHIWNFWKVFRQPLPTRHPSLPSRNT